MTEEYIMTFLEKIHKEIQFIDLVMIVMTPVWSIIAVLNFLKIIDANFVMIHFILGSCWLLWAVGFHTRWNKTGLELEQMAKEARFNYHIDGRTSADMTSIFTPNRRI